MRPPAHLPEQLYGRTAAGVTAAVLDVLPQVLHLESAHAVIATAADQLVQLTGVEQPTGGGLGWVREMSAHVHVCVIGEGESVCVCVRVVDSVRGGVGATGQVF